MPEKTTGQLIEELKTNKTANFKNYLGENRGELLAGDFAGYMSDVIGKKGLKKSEVSLSAGLSDGYGYKLLNGEKKPPYRDTVLRLCIGARMELEETQQALRICTMAPLYPRVARDALLIRVFSHPGRDAYAVDELLCDNGFEPLRHSTRD